MINIQTIIDKMEITNVISIITALGGILTFWFKFGGIISKLKTTSDQQDQEIRQLKLDLEKQKNSNDIKIEKINDKLDKFGTDISSKLSSIDKDLIETAVFLKTNVNFLSTISKDNKSRLDDHDKKFNEFDKIIYKNT